MLLKQPTAFHISPEFASLLDLCRWLSAFMVILSHLRHPILKIYAEVEEPSIFIQLFYFTTGFGTEAVLVFFVLSGFLVGGLNINKLKNETFIAPDYFIDRFSRLYVVFLPGLLLGYSLDLVGSTYLLESGLYNNQHITMSQHIVPNHVIEEQLSFTQMFGNLVMLQSFYVETLGSNFPLWSLSYEFWFYIVFGIALLSKTTIGANKFILLLVLIALFLLLGKKFVFYLFIWSFGMIIPFTNRTFLRGAIVSFGSFLLFITALIISRLKLIDSSYACDLLVASTFTLLLITMKTTKSRILIFCKRLNAFFASFSFSLYILHYPLAIFVVSAMVKVFSFENFIQSYQPSYFSIGLYLLTMSIVIFCSYLFAHMTEYRNSDCRRFLKTQYQKVIDHSERSSS